MGRRLSPEQIAAYRERGHLSPVDVLPPAEAAAIRGRLETVEADLGGPLPAPLRHKPHLTMRWAADLIRDARILDAVEGIIGPDILCWESVLFIKEPASDAFVSWHQDITYWGLGGDAVVTAWLALSPADARHGCMRVVPGTHRREVVPHTDTGDPRNMLSRGQEIAVAVDEREAVAMPLEPGQMSLHHVRIFHGSGPNRGADRRIGLAIRYLPPDLRQQVGVADSATLVRGQDRHGHFEPEPAPAADLDAAALAVLLRPT